MTMIHCWSALRLKRTMVNCLYALCQEQNIGLLKGKSYSDNGKLLVCSRSSAFMGTME